MDPIRPLSVLPPSTAIETVARSGGTAADQGGRERGTLDPAVSIELSSNAAEGRATESPRRGYERDAETQSLVFRITDALSGDVVMQIPDEIVLKARAYARQPNPPAGLIVEKRA